MKKSASFSLFLFALIAIIIISISSSSSSFFISAACSFADRNTPTSNNALPLCVRVGLLSPTPNADGSALTDTQKYWAITLPQRVWKNVKRSLTTRNVTVEEVQTSLDWAGGLTSTANGTYDIFVANFWILASRTKNVDFMIPYVRESWMLLYKTPPAPFINPIVNWSSPFPFEVWMTALAIVFCGGFVLWITELINHGWNGEHHQLILRPDEELKDDPFMMLRDADVGSYFEAGKHALSHAVGCIFDTAEVVPRSFGGWLVSWSLRWFIFVFFSSYTANLATFLSLRKAAAPLTSSELFHKKVMTVPEPEIQTMIGSQTESRSVQTFANNVGNYVNAFVASTADTAALPELDVREILLNRCDMSATSTDLSVESSFVFRKSDAVYAAKQVIDENMLQFSDFGILSKWVDSGLPTDSCGGNSGLANKGAMGLEELGGAFIVALVLCAVAILVALWTLIREKMMHQRVIRKFGEGGPHRSDDIDLVDKYVGDCKISADDAKRAAASLVELLSERTTQIVESETEKRNRINKQKQQAPKADWDKSNVKIPSAVEEESQRPETGVSGQLHQSLLLFMYDGIVTSTPEDRADDELSSDDDEREQDFAIHRSQDPNSIAHEIPTDERQQRTELSAKHLCKIRGAVVGVASALHLAEDSINRSGRRRYCGLPCETCNSRMGHGDPQKPLEEDSTETPQQFDARVKRERLHIHQLLEVARGATKAAAAAADSAQVALLSSMMHRGRRRRILEKWLNRSFRAAAFLTLLIATASRRVANESSYLSKAHLDREDKALDELSELAALTANEVEETIRSLREEHENALASPAASFNKSGVYNYSRNSLSYNYPPKGALQVRQQQQNGNEIRGGGGDASESPGKWTNVEAAKKRSSTLLSPSSKNNNSNNIDHRRNSPAISKADHDDLMMHSPHENHSRSDGNRNTPVRDVSTNQNAPQRSPQLDSRNNTRNNKNSGTVGNGFTHDGGFNNLHQPQQQRPSKPFSLAAVKMSEYQ